MVAVCLLLLFYWLDRGERFKFMGGGGFKKLQRKDLEREQTWGELRVSLLSETVWRLLFCHSGSFLRCFGAPAHRKYSKKTKFDCSFFRQDININVQTVPIIWNGVVCTSKYLLIDTRYVSYVRALISHFIFVWGIYVLSIRFVIVCTHIIFRFTREYLFFLLRQSSAPELLEPVSSVNDGLHPM